ncbi:MAG: hypothetical protein M9949_00830 [Candidatus Kapabacteria bacterium]|nr:hypothetical protein [Candidatus Kapabacteria bacterium]
MFMVTNNCGDVESEQIEVAVTSGTTDVTDVVPADTYCQHRHRILSMAMHK